MEERLLGLAAKISAQPFEAFVIGAAVFFILSVFVIWGVVTGYSVYRRPLMRLPPSGDQPMRGRRSIVPLLIFAGLVAVLAALKFTLG